MPSSIIRLRSSWGADARRHRRSLNTAGMKAIRRAELHIVICLDASVQQVGVTLHSLCEHRHTCKTAARARWSLPSNCYGAKVVSDAQDTCTAKQSSDGFDYSRLLCEWKCRNKQQLVFHQAVFQRAFSDLPVMETTQWKPRTFKQKNMSWREVEEFHY